MTKKVKIIGLVYEYIYILTTLSTIFNINIGEWHIKGFFLS